MTGPRSIAAWRLVNQHLTGPSLQSPTEVIRWMGAVQSQDYGAAKWAVAQRTWPAVDSDLDRLYDRGEILRTHVLRPTWHFVLPADIRWLLELTGPRILSGLRGRQREIGIDAVTMVRAEKTFEKALAGGRNMTRAELGGVLEASRISPEGPRLTHLIMVAELDGLLVSGPRHGKQITWTLLDSRARAPRRLRREQAVVELARRYYQSHGPAQLRDFAWWSGLSAADTRSAASDAGLRKFAIDQTEYWYVDTVAEASKGLAPRAHLLPNFDEYLVAYRDRDAALHPDRPFDPTIFSSGSILGNVLIVGGHVRGAWRRRPKLKHDLVEITLLDPLTASERTAVARAAARMQHFLGRPVEIFLRARS